MGVSLGHINKVTIRWGSTVFTWTICILNIYEFCQGNYDVSTWLSISNTAATVSISASNAYSSQYFVVMAQKLFL